MKKILFVMPLMAISLLGCNNGGSDNPDPITYTITFKNDGDPDKKIENIKAGSIVEEVPTPITPRPNSTFIGWCTDNDSKNVFDFTTIKINQDYTLYSGWKENEPEPVVTHELIYNYDNETSKSYTETYIGNDKTVKPEWEPKYLGHTFVGWYIAEGEGEEGEEFTFGKPLTQKVTNIHAHWSPAILSCSVTFDAGEGSYSSGDEIEIFVGPGTKLLSIIKLIETPTASDKTFAYYEYEGKNKAINYDDLVNEDITLKANYFPTNTEKKDDLSEFSWETLKNIAVTGDASRWFNVGATKTLEVNDINHTIRIIGFKHNGDVTLDGNQTGITFEFANLLTDFNELAMPFAWDHDFQDPPSGYNYDYRNSVFNVHLNDETADDSIINLLSIKDLIVPVNKKVGVSLNKDSSYEALSFEKYPKLFPLAYREMINEDCPSVAENEGFIYEYYADGGSINKETAGDRHDSEMYWLRSPYTYICTQVYIVDSAIREELIIGSGGLNYFAAAPAFCF